MPLPWTRVLSFNSSAVMEGTDVQIAQYLLVRAKYLKRSTSKYDSATRLAVTEFQRAHGGGKVGAPGSSHYNKKLLPHATRKQRSLLDLDEFHDELVGKHEELGRGKGQREKEPYFESGRAGRFDKQVSALKQRGGADSEEEEEEDGVAHLSEEERLSLAEAALLWAEEDVGVAPALRPIEINEAFLTQRSPLRRR